MRKRIQRCRGRSVNEHTQTQPTGGARPPALFELQVKGSRHQSIIARSPYLGHIVPRETRLPEHLLGDFAGDETRALLVPGAEDLVVVLLLIFRELPGDFRCRNGLVLVKLWESSGFRGKRAVRRGKADIEMTSADVLGSSKTTGCQRGGWAAGRREGHQTRRAARQEERI